MCPEKTTSKVKVYSPRFVLLSAYLLTSVLFFSGILYLFFSKMSFSKEYLATLLIFSFGGLFFHEFIHYSSAKMMGVENLGFRLTVHGILFTYRKMTGVANILVPLSPAVISLLLMLVSVTLPEFLKQHIFVLSWVSYSSAGFDILSTIIFVKDGGEEASPLFTENGSVVGGVIKGKSTSIILIKNVKKL